MGNVLVYCEANVDKLKTSALAGIAFARQAAEKHGGNVVLVLLGKGISNAGKDAARYAPKVVVVDDAALEHAMAETYAPLLARVTKEQGASVLCATATAAGKDILPRAA